MSDKIEILEELLREKTSNNSTDIKIMSEEINIIKTNLIAKEVLIQENMNNIHGLSEYIENNETVIKAIAEDITTLFDRKACNCEK